MQCNINIIDHMLDPIPMTISMQDQCINQNDTLSYARSKSIILNQYSIKFVADNIDQN